MPRKQSKVPQVPQTSSAKSVSIPTREMSYGPSVIGSMIQGMSVGLGSSIGHSLGHSIFGQGENKVQHNTQDKCQKIQEIIKECESNKNETCDFLYKKFSECQGFSPTKRELI